MLKIMSSASVVAFPTQNLTESILEKNLATARAIACVRARCLGVPLNTSSQGNERLCAAFTELHGGLPILLISFLRETFDAWKRFYHLITNHNGRNVTQNISRNDRSLMEGYRVHEEEGQERLFNGVFFNSNEARRLQRVMNIFAKVSKLDPILCEEICRAGSQSIISQLVEQIKDCISIAESLGLCDNDLDSLMDLLDSACEVLFPHNKCQLALGFSNDDLRRRLPLIFEFRSSSTINDSVENVTTILIQQVTKRQKAQVDVGFVVWPSSIVLARWLLCNQYVLEGKSILEIGAGCGLVGILAAMITHKTEKPQQVLITDVNDKVIENINQNIILNGVSSTASVVKFDFHRHHSYCEKWIDRSLDRKDERSCQAIDIILGADIICQPDDSVAVAKTICNTLAPQGVAYIVCANSNHRYGVEIFARECEGLGLHVTASDVNDLQIGDLPINCLGIASGYVENMTLTFYEVKKLNVTFV